MTVRPERVSDARAGSGRRTQEGIAVAVNRRRSPRPSRRSVPVSQPVRRQVTDFVDFTGRTEAVHSVDIRSRVTGYLVKMPFQEGEEVKAGDLLFVVDPPALQGPARPGPGAGRSLPGLAQAGQDDPGARPGHQLACRRAQSASSNSIRNRPTVDEAEARVKAYEKSMEISRLNHEFTRSSRRSTARSAATT